MSCLTDTSRTTGGRHRVDQTDVQVEASEGHGRRCRRQLSDQVNTEQRHHPDQQPGVGRYKPSSQPFRCCDTGDRLMCLRHEVVAVQKLLQSPLYNSLQWLREERQIRYRSVVLHLAGVQSALLQQWTNYSSLEVGRKTTNSQWLVVAQQRNERRQQCLHVLHKPCWDRVELTRLTLWWADQIFHFVSSHWSPLVQGRRRPIRDVENIFIRFGTIHERDGRTDGQTPHDDIGLAYASHRAARSNNKHADINKADRH